MIMEDNNYVDKIFFIPLAHIEVTDWQSKKSDLLESFKKVNIEYEQSVWTNYYNDSSALSSDVAKILNEEILKFHAFFGFNKSIITNSWIEKSGQNDYHRPHTHGSTGYSAICFVEFDKSCHEGTRLISPFLNFVDGNALHHVSKVDEGSLIFFPSSILHYTLPNKSEKDRLILSFNLEILTE